MNYWVYLMKSKISDLILILLLYLVISSCAKKDNLSFLVDEEPYDYADFELAEL